MKISTKTTSKLIVLLVIAIAFGFTASSCIQGDTSTPANNEPEKRQDNSHLQKSSCQAEHVIGSSPCPQPVCSVPVYCGKTENSCTADSAIIVAQKPGLTCTFDNGETWTTLDSDPTKGTNLNIEFTCNVAATIEETFIIRTFEGGLEVDEEPFTVKVDVK